MLKKQTVTLNNAILHLLIGNKLAKSKIHLHHKNSYLEVPGLVAKKTFDIPAWHKHVSTPFPLPDLDIYYKVNDINSKGTFSKCVARGGKPWTVKG